jgi:predicted ArsR family transcriptional regulator
MARKNEDGVFVAGSSRGVSNEELARLVEKELSKGPHSMGALTKRFQAKANAKQIREVLASMGRDGLVSEVTNHSAEVGGRPLTVYSLT